MCKKLTVNYVEVLGTAALAGSCGTVARCRG